MFHYAKEGDVFMLEHFVSTGRDVNATDSDGMTVLHHAVAVGARPCIRMLVHHNKCDYLIRDNKGRFASDIAMEWSQDYAVARLLSKLQKRQALARNIDLFPTEDSRDF